MKKLLGGIAISALMTAPVFAADLPARMPVKAPPPVVVTYNWSGCYIGGNVGGAWGRSDWTTTANTTAFGDTVPGQGYSSKDSGIIGGGQIGCNIQTGQWVFGIEGTGSGSSLKSNLNNTVFGAADDQFEWKNRWLATVVGRAGVAVNNWLFYAKGGFAAGGFSLSVNDVIAPAGSGSDKQTHVGWTAGGGIEYGLTANWILGVDYSYYRFSKESYQLAGSAAPATFTFDFKPKDIHAVVGRISYKFGGPVVARY